MRRILSAGITYLDSDKFITDSGNESLYLNKPRGFLYGLTLLKNMIPNRPIYSSWLYFVESDFSSKIDKYSKGISFVLNKNARVYTINTPEDYKKLYQDGYTIHCNETNYRYIRSIDFEKLSKDYDAFHLTEEAFLYMRLPMDDYILRVNYATKQLEDDSVIWKPVELKDFYSYDCETWIIFNLDCINKGSILNHHYKLQSMYDD